MRRLASPTATRGSANRLILAPLIEAMVERMTLSGAYPWQDGQETLFSTRLTNIRVPRQALAIRSHKDRGVRRGDQRFPKWFSLQ